MIVSFFRDCDTLVFRTSVDAPNEITAIRVASSRYNCTPNAEFWSVNELNIKVETTR